MRLEIRATFLMITKKIDVKRHGKDNSLPCLFTLVSFHFRHFYLVNLKACILMNEDRNEKTKQNF